MEEHGMHFRMSVSEPEPWEVALQEMQKCRLAPWQSPTELQDEAVWAYGRLEENYRQWRKERVMKKYSLIVLDVDGTLVETKSGETFRKTANDWQWLPGRLEKLQELREQGVEIAFASNQGGVPLGYMSRHDIEHEILLMAVQVPTLRRYICYAYPPNKNEYYTDREFLFFRKPNPGMLLQAMLDAKACVPETLMVGDRPEDEQAAQNAGVAFMWADKFFGEQEKRMETQAYLGHVMDIAWSEEDQLYVVMVPDLPGCMTHGDTYEEAVQQGKDAIESWLSWED